MNSKGQFVTIIFSILLISAIIAVFSLEYNNLILNQHITVLQTGTAITNSIYYNLLSQYAFVQSLSPSSVANSFLVSAIEAIKNAYFNQYNLNFSNGLVINGEYGSVSPLPSLILNIVNAQPTATPAPFQQLITINSSAYSQYEAPSLDNIRFSYPNGTIIPSWLESGNMAIFNGSGAYVGVSSGIPESSTTSSLTWSVWAQARNYPSNNWRYIINLVGCNGGILTSQGGWILVEFRNGTCASNFINFSYDAPIDTWNYYVVTWSNVTKTLSFYVNGKLIGNKTAYNHEAWTALNIGTWTGSIIGTAFNGSITNVQIYSTALTPAVISGMYYEGLNGAPLNTFYSSLVGWWPLIGNVNDVLSSGPSAQNNGVLFNFAGAASNKTLYWLRLGSLPADSTTEILMDFYPTDFNVFNNKITGEAPQLSSTYAEYDDGANVFNDYYNGSSISGWTTSGYAGDTSSAPSGSPFGKKAMYANSSVGDFLYTLAPGQSTNMIIEYYTYITGLNDVFFLENSTGAGQLARQGDGTGWYGIAATSSWTSWGAPPDTGSWTNEWVLAGVIVTGGSATQYLSSSPGTYGSELGQNPSNTYAVSNKGIYLGLIGDGLSSLDEEYWNGVLVRAYPPNGVMPYVIVGGVQ
jgi:hypothetical protein